MTKHCEHCDAIIPEEEFEYLSENSYRNWQNVYIMETDCLNLVDGAVHILEQYGSLSLVLVFWNLEQ